MSAIITPDQVLELRIGRDGKVEQYTARQFKADIMRSNARANAKFYAGVRDTWQKDTTKDPQAKRRFKRYSFTRDSIEGPQEHVHSNFGGVRFADEVNRLYTSGLLSSRFCDAARSPNIYDDDVAYEVFRDIQGQLASADSRMAQRIVDAAPTVFAFTELLKRSEVLIEEELTRLWARTIFPVRNLNTWLTQWTYNRLSDVDAGFPQYVDADQTPSNISSSKEKRGTPTRRLVFYDYGASWTQHELWIAAEAVANGAPSFGLDQRRINNCRRQLLWKENVLAFFGDGDVDILGLMSPEADTGIERIKSPTQFGSGDAEADRMLLINTVMQIRDNTEDILEPNMVGLDSKSFNHVISRRYGSVDNPSNETVADAALDTLRKVGINSFTYIPELGPREKEATRLRKKGLSVAEATRLSGGGQFDIAPDGDPPDIQQAAAMLVARRDAEVMEMILAKDITMYPAAETVRGKTEIRMIQGSGGVEFYRPEGVKLVTNVVGPDTLPVAPTPAP